MGGSIAVTLRESDGKEHRMCRWTNVMPYWINNLGMIKKDQEFIKEFLKEWYNMREDYLENKDNKELKFKSEPLEVLDKYSIGGGTLQRFKYNMTDAYAPYPYLAPYGYGLIVIDMKTDHILHCQGYCSIGEISFSNIDLRNKDKLTQIQQLVNTKRIRKIIDTNDDYKELKSFTAKSEDRFFVELVLDMTPFRIIRYKEDLKGWRNFKKKLQKLGFELSEEEEEIWNDYMSRFRGYHHVKIEY